MAGAGDGPRDAHDGLAMIDRLVLRDIGVIDEATIDFHPGLTVLTGETGAGKTMVLTGLALLAGAKADAGIVRSGAPSAAVDGEWTVPTGEPVLERLADAGADVDDDGRLVLARTVAAEGRSRAFAGGRSVPAAVLAETCERLVAVHGQAEQQRLRSADTQRELVDRFAGLAATEALAAFRTAFAQWRADAAALAALETDRETRARDAGMLALAIEEIERLAPQPGEDRDLERRAARLQHAGSLVTDVMGAHDALVGGDDLDGANVLVLLAGAQHALERAAALDPDLAPRVTQLREILDLVPDLATDLASYARSIDADPVEQARVEERRSALAALARRHGSVDEALAWLAEAQARVAEVSGDDDRLEDLRQRVADGRSQVAARAADLTAIRIEAASRLAAAVTEELHALAMPDASVEIAIESARDVDRFAGHGADAVDIRLAPHRGADPRPVTRGASGGELSRVMLAIEVALAGADPVPTFVFDEVDAGIGGRAAVEVGRRLCRLAHTAQVIVVTHLPQVAAFADRHVVVTKESGSVTASSVRPVEGRDRLEELVRMLSGLEASEAGAAHAEELLEVAAAERGETAHAARPRVARSGTTR